MATDSNSQNLTLQSTGLPNVPKVLNVIANSVSSQWQDSAKVYAAQIAMSMVRNLFMNCESDNSSQMNSLWSFVLLICGWSLGSRGWGFRISGLDRVWARIVTDSHEP